MRYLALDWGSVRVGAAVSDPDGKIAFPLDKFIDSQNAIDEIKQIIQELDVQRILIGLPRGMEGQETESTKSAQKFIQDIKIQTTVGVELLDERLSSVAAGKTLSGMGLSEKEQRNIKDNIAAQLMLQQYINNKNN